MKTVFGIIVALAIAIPATWFVARNRSDTTNAASTTARNNGGERKLLYYQSAMHPWIKSDKPGRCTICGMELTPVYEGDAGMDASGGDVVSLTQSMIQVVNVETAPVERRPIAKTLSVAGMIDDNQTRHRILSAYIPGRIEKLYVNFVGAEVKEGQPLAEFYSPNLLQAEREYRSLTGDLRTATALRLQQMGVTPAQIEQLGTKGGDKLTSQILAPIGGTVVAQNAYEGQYVQEGEKLLEIADFSTMWFQFRAYEQDLPWIKLGLNVDVTTPSVPGQVFSGKVTFIDPNFEEATRSTKVRVELENPLVNGRRLLLHRLYADGRVHLDAPESLALPRTALIETGPEAVVYVDQGEGRYARRVVKLGRRGDKFVEAMNGVQAGDKVVINGNLLIDGQAEMNRSFSQTAHEESGTKSSQPLSEREKDALISFIKVHDSLSAALAKDDLDAFNRATGLVMSEADKLTDALKTREELKDILAHVAEARHLHEVKDLASARKAYHPFANASAKALDLLREAPGIPLFQVFECPMVDQAIPGVAKKGRWVQADGRAMGNPYFGAEMLECGKRVIPEGAL